MQQKDVIYIDVEDDITAIIGKVKNAKEKIVALVPPKRTGVLQSAVNLKLLARAAKDANKRLVLITHNAALGGLAASAEIPVAKNLHTRPELAKSVANEDDEDDVIDGEQLPVGDHAGMDDEGPESSIEDLDIDGEPAPIKSKKAAGVAAGVGAVAAKAKNGIKVPDFGSFRKKLAIGVGVGILLILFLVWANVVAPHATIVVSARTTGQSLSTPVTLGTDQTTDSDKATIKTITQSEKTTQSVAFDATGSKDVGDRATGTVKFSQQSLSPVTIPAGTQLTSNGGLVFVTNSAATVPASTFGGPSCFPTACPGTITATVTAAVPGTDYNNASGNLSGAPSGVSASFSSPTSGGTDKVVKVVTQDDVEKAKVQLASDNQDAIKNKVKAKFSKTDIVINNSFTGSGDPQPSPAIGQEAESGKATLTSAVTYTMTGIPKDEMDTYLSDAFDKTLTNKNAQRVYDNGVSTVAFDGFTAGDKTSTATLTATAQIGPKINDADIKEQAKGKRSGEVIGDIKTIDGVSDVQVNLSPFWVQGVPGDVKKISVEFKLITNG